MEINQTEHDDFGSKQTEPDIDQQIEYVNHVRNHVIKHIKPLQSEMRMILAIEQTLIAAKWMAWHMEQKIPKSNQNNTLRDTSKRHEKN